MAHSSKLARPHVVLAGPRDYCVRDNRRDASQRLAAEDCR